MNGFCVCRGSSWRCTRPPKRAGCWMRRRRGSCTSARRKSARSKAARRRCNVAEQSEHEGLVLEELRRADESGDAVSRAELQEACGLGAGDLGAAIETLRDRGLLTEEAPDEFELADERAVQAAAAVERAGDDEADDDREPPAERPARRERTQ